MNVNDNISTKVKLRDLTLPEDYAHIARLINSIEPGSTTIEDLEHEEQHIPTTSSLTLYDLVKVIIASLKNWRFNHGKITIFIQAKPYSFIIR